MEHYADFVRSECDYVEGEMSVGMFPTPLTLSAAALSWIPCLNFNRCSTVRIRREDRALLFLCAVCYACIMRMSGRIFFLFFFSRSPWEHCWLNYMCTPLYANARISLCVCVCSCPPSVCVSAGGHAAAFDSAACMFSLTQHKGTSCPEKGLKNRSWGSCGLFGTLILH